MSIQWKYLTTFEQRRHIVHVTSLMTGSIIFLSICLLALAVPRLGALSSILFCLGALGLRYYMNALMLTIIFTRYFR